MSEAPRYVIVLDFSHELYTFLNHCTKKHSRKREWVGKHNPSKKSNFLSHRLISFLFRFSLFIFLSLLFMYSPTQQQFHMDAGNAQSSNSPHTTVGAVPVARSSRVMPSYQHQRQGSFGAASIAMSPTGPGRSIQFGDQSWLGTSVDSTGSSFGQSPPFYGGGAAGRDLVVSPSNSTSQLEGITGDEEDPLAQRQ